VTDEVIMQYIETQELTKEDDDFRVDNGRIGKAQSGFQPTGEPTGFRPVVVQFRRSATGEPGVDTRSPTLAPPTRRGYDDRTRKARFNTGPFQ
jgi:hypothetical protein